VAIENAVVTLCSKPRGTGGQEASTAAMATAVP
jgi:hypothetical protein